MIWKLVSTLHAIAKPQIGENYHITSRVKVHDHLRRCDSIVMQKSSKNTAKNSGFRCPNAAHFTLEHCGCKPHSTRYNIVLECFLQI